MREDEPPCRKHGSRSIENRHHSRKGFLDAAVGSNSLFIIKLVVVVEAVDLWKSTLGIPQIESVSGLVTFPPVGSDAGTKAENRALIPKPLS